MTMIQAKRPLSMSLEAYKDDKIAALIPKTEHQETLLNIAAASPYLCRLMLRYPNDTSRIASNEGEALLKDLLADLDTPRPEDEKTAALMRSLRISKERLALSVALQDLLSLWPLERVTETLSSFADKTVEIALRHAMANQVRRGFINLGKDAGESTDITLARSSGFFILGLGKLGGLELNYSSDIDLIALYDPERLTLTGEKSAHDIFVKITRDVVDILDRRTEDGYVFRVDLRLRPDPGATPVAISTHAAESYYQSAALNWERAAMIKARPIAGDLIAANSYLERMSGWIWRRTVDYTALADLIAIKNQVNRHHDQQDRMYEGYDVKLGPGGIREIEFFAQIHQLLHGGRNPSLRTKSTVHALEILSHQGLSERAATDTLIEAYKDWRTLEHRIQMIHDGQTHTIPENEHERERVYALAGFASDSDLKGVVLDLRHTVSKLYDTLLPGSAQPEKHDQAWLIRSMETLGFSPSGAHLIEGWRRGRYRALRSAKSRQVLDDCLPELLNALANAHAPDAALSRFDSFLRQLPTGIQLFAMLKSNPRLFDLLARIMVLSPALPERLAKQPDLWDVVLDPGFFEPLEKADTLQSDLESRLKGLTNYEQILDCVRYFHGEQIFRLGVHSLEGLTSIDQCCDDAANLADAVIRALLPHVMTEFARRHGHFENGGLAVIALGQYGGGSLTVTSDLDLILTYTVEDQGGQSTGTAKPLAPSAYYSRLAQAWVTALTTRTKAGALFDVDMRLRPNGNQGPLAVSIHTLERYYREEAWTWEHMALTRARVITAPDGQNSTLSSILKSPILQPREKDVLCRAVNDMRGKLRETNPAKADLDVKHQIAGLVDIEFLTQYLLLKHSAAHPDILTPSIHDSLTAMSKIGILDHDDAALLRKTYRMLRQIQATLRLCMGTDIAESETLPPAVQAFLCQTMGTDSLDELIARKQDAQRAVAILYQTHLKDDDRPQTS